MHFIVAMGGNYADIEAVMNSDRLRTLLVTKIIDGCSDVSLVSFGPDGTDWREDFGLINGQVEKFRCWTPDRPESPPWGYHYCR